ncbi:FimV/HubP family polar landmark protein [Pseudomonas typographi]|uniref:FimV/HubP family polar landmark protein n=1 Tax=Pseudomonas typographi TaxID=2715964 RepID=UPI001683D5A2|nr:FimV/HubP family polar landmark protein [Pseudomonas typographi]MBD1590018.1 LysM peptidoglycan-binding domain-containing protein [Pseudomonas typographi]
MCFSPSGMSRARPVKAHWLAGLLCLGVLSWSSFAVALGLGDIDLHSGLNQPFNADIDLIDADGLGPEDLRVSLASPEAFAAAGMERAFFLADLRFTTVFGQGRPFIHVESSKAVVEPYLSLLVQVDRPNGQVLRGYTLLIDPPGAVPLAPARVPSYGSRAAQATTAEPNPASAPAQASAALPPASEGKQYVVQKGDTLWTIGKQLQAAGTPTPPNQLVRDIRALNPGRAPLKVGQSLLLPDAAVLPRPPSEAPEAEEAVPGDAPTATDDAPPPPPVEQAPAPDMAASVLNQQLQQNLDALQAQVKGLEGEVASKNQQLSALQGQLAAPQAARPANPPPAAVPVPAAPAAVPPSAAVPVSPVVQDNSWILQLAALVLLLLLVGLLGWRRYRATQAAPTAQEPPAEATPAVYAAPAAVAPAMLAQAPVDTPPAPARKAAAATDALDGASIYIAYGRFNEALGILREGLRREPGRTDLRLRILDVLAQQGDAQGYAAEEQALRDHGAPAHELEQVRQRYPKIALALAVGATAAAVASPEAAEASAALGELDEPELIADVPRADVQAVAEHDAAPLAEDELLGLDLSDLPDLDRLGTLGEPAAPSEAADEFQLNLDDLSLDADWASVDPFDSPAKVRALGGDEAPEDEAEQRLPLPDTLEPGFTSNLNEFPEVFEMPEGHYLDEFGTEPDAAEVEKVNEFDASALALDLDLDLDFLDELGDPLQPEAQPPQAPLPELDDLPELEALSVDFEAIENQQRVADKLDQARALLDHGEQDQASRLLHELLLEGDDASRQGARALLARLER